MPCFTDGEPSGFGESPGARGLQHNNPVLHQRGVLGPFACCLPGSPLTAGLAGDAVLIPSLVLALPAWGENLTALLHVPRR